MSAAAGAAVLLLVLAVAGLRKLRRGPEHGAMVQTALPPGAEREPGLADGDSMEKRMQAKLGDQAELQARLEAEALDAMKSPTPTNNKKDMLTKYLQAGLKKDPVVQVQTIRTWLNEKA
jgi:hypothetical protein